MPYILMHMRGTPETMQQHTQYSDTCLEVGQELQQQASKAVAAGIEPWRILLDPGQHVMPQCYTLIRMKLECSLTSLDLLHVNSRSPSKSFQVKVGVHMYRRPSGVCVHMRQSLSCPFEAHVHMQRCLSESSVHAQVQVAQVCREA